MEEKQKELKDYSDYLKYQKNYSDYTILSYDEDIEEFLAFCKRENLNFKDLEYSDIRFYLMFLKDEKKLDNSSIDRKLSSLRGFYKYMANEKIVNNNEKAVNDNEKTENIEENLEPEPDYNQIKFENGIFHQLFDF